MHDPPRVAVPCPPVDCKPPNRRQTLVAHVKAQWLYKRDCFEGILNQKPNNNNNDKAKSKGKKRKK